MTRSYNLNHYPDADYTPGDIGPPDGSTLIEAWDTFEDMEANEKMMLERGDAPL